MDIGYHIIDTRETLGYVRDAARPFVVVEVYRAGYKSGNRKMTHGNYPTRAAAQRRLRTVEAR